MTNSVEETYGKLALWNILSHIWMGDWDNYETIFEEIPSQMKDAFPFHKHYKKEDVSLWYDNYFVIPGDYFVSPYHSSYTSGGGDAIEQTKKDLLCLIGLYERVGYFYPLEKEIYPDHFGSLTGFLVSAVREEIQALQNKDEELAEEMRKLQNEVLDKYIRPVLRKFRKEADSKITQPFFREFVDYYQQVMEDETKIAM